MKIGKSNYPFQNDGYLSLGVLCQIKSKLPISKSENCRKNHKIKYPGREIKHAKTIWRVACGN